MTDYTEEEFLEEEEEEEEMESCEQCSTTYYPSESFADLNERFCSVACQEKSGGF